MHRAASLCFVSPSFVSLVNCGDEQNNSFNRACVEFQVPSCSFSTCRLSAADRPLAEGVNLLYRQQISSSVSAQTDKISVCSICVHPVTNFSFRFHALLTQELCRMNPTKNLTSTHPYSCCSVAGEVTDDVNFNHH